MINLKKFFGLEKYVSELDLFLTQYNQSHPGKSFSEQQEIDKYALISLKRDQNQDALKPSHSLIKEILG